MDLNFISFDMWYRGVENGLCMSKRSKKYWSLNTNKFDFSIMGYKIISGRYIISDSLFVVTLNNKEEYRFSDCNGFICSRKILI